MLFSGEPTVAIVIPSDIVSEFGKHEQQRQYQLVSLLTGHSQTSAIETNEDALVRFGLRATGLPYWPVDGFPAVHRFILGADTPTSDRKDGDSLQSTAIVEPSAESLSWFSEHLRTLSSVGSTSLTDAAFFVTAASPMANETFSHSDVFFASPTGYPDSTSAVATWNTTSSSGPPRSSTTYLIENRDTFVNSLASITDAAATEEAIVAVLGMIDDLLIDQRVGECNDILRRLDTQRTHSDILLAFLMATASAPREQFPSRENLYAETRQRFVDELGDSEASEILDRLR